MAYYFQESAGRPKRKRAGIEISTTYLTTSVALENGTILLLFCLDTGKRDTEGARHEIIKKKLVKN
jgi:hypothetical protein